MSDALGFRGKEQIAVAAFANPWQIPLLLLRNLRSVILIWLLITTY